MVTIANRKVSAISEKQLKVSWALSGSADFEEEISVSRSEAPEGPWEVLALLSPGVTQYLDTPNEFYFHRDYYYLVQSTADVTDVDSVKLGYLPDNISIEMARIQTRHLERDIGELCAVFHKTTTGIRCTTCWDSDLDQVTQDDCPTCLGTRFEEGFGEQVDAWIHLPLEDIAPLTSQMDMPREQDARMATMSNYPVIDRGDIIIEKGTKNIWMVPEKAQVSRSSKRGFLISQSFQVDHISPSSVLTKLLAVMV